MNKKQEVIEKDEIKEMYDKIKKVPKEISQEIVKKIFKNIIKAIFIILYVMVLNLAYIKIQEARLVEYLKIFAGVFLIFGLIGLEYAYKKDNGSIAITGIESLVLSMHTLSIMHICTFLKYDFRFYLLTSSYIFSIYYVLKSIVIYTTDRKAYLESLSDISDIVKKEEPVIKEARKRNEKTLAEKEVKKVGKETSNNKPKSKSSRKKPTKASKIKNKEEKKPKTTRKSKK